MIVDRSWISARKMRRRLSPPACGKPTPGASSLYKKHKLGGRHVSIVTP
jgi:hypothetical protein